MARNKAARIFSLFIDIFILLFFMRRNGSRASSLIKMNDIIANKISPTS